MPLQLFKGYTFFRGYENIFTFTMRSGLTPRSNGKTPLDIYADCGGGKNWIAFSQITTRVATRPVVPSFRNLGNSTCVKAQCSIPNHICSLIWRKICLDNGVHLICPVQLLYLPKYFIPTSPYHSELNVSFICKRIVKSSGIHTWNLDLGKVFYYSDIFIQGLSNSNIFGKVWALAIAGCFKLPLIWTWRLG